jgi:5-methyltetrahydropteroyltriglutamate--homocysteine methyltransferase
MLRSFPIRRRPPMSQHAALPARYDHVGSFLRPHYLLEAREQKAKGAITPEQLRSSATFSLTQPNV